MISRKGESDINLAPGLILAAVNYSFLPQTSPIYSDILIN